MRIRMFKPQFAQMVKDGTKRQTIRPVPKQLPFIGQQESWRKWCGKPYRSKQIELAKVIIMQCSRITIVGYGIFIIDGKDAPWDTAQDIARLDGFDSLDEMMKWFVEHHNLPFDGILIKAKDL